MQKGLIGGEGTCIGGAGGEASGGLGGGASGDADKKKRKHGSWANLKGDGQLATKEGNGEQIRVMVTGVGSVIGCPRPTPRQRRHGAYGHKYIQVS